MSNDALLTSLTIAEKLFKYKNKYEQSLQLIDVLNKKIYDTHFYDIPDHLDFLTRFFDLYNNIHIFIKNLDFSTKNALFYSNSKQKILNDIILMLFNVHNFYILNINNMPNFKFQFIDLLYNISLIQYYFGFYASYNEHNIQNLLSIQVKSYEIHNMIKTYINNIP
jgi:hypothetical protein